MNRVTMIHEIAKLAREADPDTLNHVIGLLRLPKSAIAKRPSDDAGEVWRK